MRAPACAAMHAGRGRCCFETRPDSGWGRGMLVAPTLLPPSRHARQCAPACSRHPAATMSCGRPPMLAIPNRHLLAPHRPRDPPPDTGCRMARSRGLCGARTACRRLAGVGWARVWRPPASARTHRTAAQGHPARLARGASAQISWPPCHRERGVRPCRSAGHGGRHNPRRCTAAYTGLVPPPSR